MILGKAAGIFGGETRPVASCLEVACPSPYKVSLNSTTMVSITVAPAGKKAPSLARGLPHTVTIPSKAYADVTVGDVKAALAAKYPKVRVPSLRKMSFEANVQICLI